MTRQDLPAGLAVTRTLARATVCALVSALSLAACTGGASPEATPIPTTVGPAPGPLEAYLGEGADAGGAGGRTEAEVVAEVAAREEAVAACMAAHGIEYWPPTIVPGTFQTSDEPLRGTQEFAERYGYGVWTGPEVEPGQHAYQLGDSASAGYRASLTPEARRAYDEALHGRLTEVPDGWVSDGTGCTELAAVRLSPEAEYPCVATDDGLQPGDYELVAAAVLANTDGSDLVALSQGPVPFTVGARPGGDAADQAAAEQAVGALVAGAGVAGTDQPAGTCGTLLPTDPDPLLRLEMTLVGSSFAPGALIEGDAAISARDGLTVMANGPITSVHVVLVTGGVVVGRGDYDPEYVDLMTFTDEAAYPLPAYANAIVCAAPGTEPTGLGLPAGTYQAYGLYEVALKEVQRADGTAESRSETLTVVSDPVDVVIEDQG